MKYVLACLTIALLVFAATAANAQVMDGGYYIGVAGGYTLQQFDALADDFGFDADEWKESWAGHVFVGWNYSDVLAIEADVGYYLKWEPDADPVAVGDEELKLITGTVSVKYTILIGESAWKPYVLGGIGWGRFETDGGVAFMLADEDGVLDTEQSGLLWRVGGGVGGPITDTVDFVGDVTYVITTGDIEDLNFVDFRFGVRINF